MKIQIIDETGINAADTAALIDGLRYFTPLVTQAWGLEAVTVGTDPGDVTVYITERNRHLGAAGYHTVENGKVVAYISKNATPTLWGRYHKALVFKGRQIHGAVWESGLISVICHEIAELLVDPVIKNYSALDIKGRSWLIEVCDHVFGSYSMSTFGNNQCVFPDVTTPNFYKTNSVAPYSIFHGATAPFTMTPKGYGYYRDSTGKLTKI